MQRRLVKTLHLYWSGARDLFIDEAHTVLGIFPVFFPCMLPTPLCGFSLIGECLGLETEVYETLGLVSVLCEILNHIQSRSRFL